MPVDPQRWAGDMSARRTRHWTDLSDSGVKTRRIKNNSNWRIEGDIWRPSNPRALLATGAPPFWVGQFDFEFWAQDGPAQCAFGDATDPDNRCMVGVRSAGNRSPGVAPALHWLNLKLVGANPVSTSVSADGKTVEWVEVLTNTTIRYVLHPAGLRLEIEFSAPGHPTTLQWTAKKPASTQFEYSDGGASVVFPDGDVVFTMPQPSGRATGDMFPGIGASLSDGGKSKGLQVIDMAVDPDDLSGATYPVVVS